MERKLLCQLFTATNCSTLVGMPDYFRFNFVQVVTASVVTSRRSRDRDPGVFSCRHAAARSVVFVFIKISTLTYLRKISMYQTNSVYVKLYLYSTM